MTDGLEEGRPRDGDPVRTKNHPEGEDSTASEDQIGVCILCGNNRPLTGEHIFAAWMGRASDYDADKSQVYFSFDGKETLDIVETKRGHKNNTLKVLCESCNHEWSSAIQNDASKIFLPMLKGKSSLSDLSFRKRKQLAVWANLFVAVRQYVHPELVAISPTEMLIFRNRKEPFSFSHVWMLPSKADENFFSQYRSMSIVSSEALEGPHQRNSFMCVWSFENFTVVTYRSTNSEGRNMCSLGQLALRTFLYENGFSEVWPPYSKIGIEKKSFYDHSSIRTIIDALTAAWSIDRSMKIEMTFPP